MQFDRQKSLELNKWVLISAIQTKINPNESVASLVRENATQRLSALEWAKNAIDKNPNTELILLPEASIDFTARNRSAIVLDKIADFAVRHQKPVLFSYTERIENTTPERLYNHAQLIASNGAKDAAYQKRILTPFYEYNPLQSWFPMKSKVYIPGKENRVMKIGNANIIPAICYELHAAQHMREFLNMGGNCIVHLSNFYSFGGGVIAYFDLAMAKVWAAQYRVPIVRAGNYNYGASIDATGQIIIGSYTKPGMRAGTTFPILLSHQRSIFTIYGNVFLYLITAIWFIDSGGIIFYLCTSRIKTER